MDRGKVGAMQAQADDYPETLARITALVVGGDRPEAELEMAKISYSRRETSKRPGVPRLMQLNVFRRDSWTCRYCGGQAIFIPVMALLGQLFPEHFPYVATWKGGATHPAVTARAAVVDHIVPGSLGGAWLDHNNMATACWPCNERKGDLTLEILGWPLHQSAQTSWDGLSVNYRRLWELAGGPTQDAHPLWLRALQEDR